MRTHLNTGGFTGGLRIAGGIAVLAALLLAGAWGTANAGEEPLRHRMENLTSYMFHFGGGVGENAVTRVQMEEFIEEMIAPSFATGTSYHEVSGHWRSPLTGKILKERTFVLYIECYPEKETKEKIEAIAMEYVKRYENANVSCFIKIFPGVTTDLFYYKQ